MNKFYYVSYGWRNFGTPYFQLSAVITDKHPLEWVKEFRDKGDRVVTVVHWQEISPEEASKYARTV